MTEIMPSLQNLINLSYDPRPKATVFFLLGKLLSLRCRNRAGVGATPAVNAGIRVNYVFAVSLRDRLDRALCRASAAGNAVIGNMICHLCDLPR